MKFKAGAWACVWCNLSIYTVHSVFLHTLHSHRFNIIQLKIETALYPLAFPFPLSMSCRLVATPSCFSLSVASQEATQWRSMLGFREDQFAMFVAYWTLVSMPIPRTSAPRCKLVCGRLWSRWRHCGYRFSFDTHIVMFASWVQVPESLLSSFDFLHLQLIQLECLQNPSDRAGFLVLIGQVSWSPSRLLVMIT